LNLQQLESTIIKYIIITFLQVRVWLNYVLKLSDKYRSKIASKMCFMYKIQKQTFQAINFSFFFTLVLEV